MVLIMNNLENLSGMVSLPFFPDVVPMKLRFAS